MPTIKKTFEDYCVLANNAELEFLHTPDQMPADTDQPALWRDIPSGVVYKRTYKYIRLQLERKNPVTPAQRYRQDYLNKYYLIAEKFSIEFLYDPTVDVAPTSTKDPVKWRNPITGQVVVASYKDLAYSGQPKAVLDTLGIPHEAVVKWDFRDMPN